MDNSSDLSLFKTSLTKYIDYAVKVVELHGMFAKPNAPTNPLIQTVKLFKSNYEKSNESEITLHYIPIFQDILQARHDDIINDGHKNTDWLTKGTFIVDIIKHMGITLRNNKSKLYLSVLYSTAVKVKESAEDKLEKAKSMPNVNIAGFPEINYPDALLLYLYGIFASIASGNDRIILNSIRSEIEEDLGITGKSATENAAPSGNPMDFISGMLNNLPNMGKNGMPPELKNMLTSENVKRMASGVIGDNPQMKAMFDNPIVSNTLDSVLTKVGNGDVAGIFQDIMKGSASASQTPQVVSSELELHTTPLPNYVEEVEIKEN